MRAGDGELVGAALADIGDEDFPHADIQRRRMTWRPGFQSLKSPTTATRSALGAQTAKWTPPRPDARSGARPSCHRGGSDCLRPSGNRQRSEDGAEAVRIGDPPFRAVTPRARYFTGWAGPLTAPSNRPRARDALQSPRRAGQVEGRDLLRNRHQRPQERAARSFMRSQQREGIGVAALDQGIQSGTGWLHITFQISSAYCRMVRSEENHPTFATLWMAEVAQPAWSCQRVSTLRCAAV